MNAITEAIETLYRVFSPYCATAKMAYCQECVGQSQVDRLFAKPLRQLGVAHFATYLSKAISTWGDIADYKHFFPRVCELALVEPFPMGIEPWFSRLAIAKWKTWPDAEYVAIHDYFHAAWRATIVGSSTDPSVVDWLSSFVNAGVEVESFVAELIEVAAVDENARMHLVVLNDEVDLIVADEVEAAVQFGHAQVDDVRRMLAEANVQRLLSIADDSRH